MGYPRHENRTHNARRYRARHEARRTLRGDRADTRPEARRPRVDGGVEDTRVLCWRAGVAAQQCRPARAAQGVRPERYRTGAAAWPGGYLYRQQDAARDRRVDSCGSDRGEEWRVAADLAASRRREGREGNSG